MITWGWLVLALVIGIGLGYGFRGKIRRLLGLAEETAQDIKEKIDEKF